MRPAGGNYGPPKRPIIEMNPNAAIPGLINQRPADKEDIDKEDIDNLDMLDGQVPGDDKRYTAAKVMSANPLELILIMYEQLFELVPDIKANMEKRSPTDFGPDTERAQAILDQLINSLDFDQEISVDLGAIYFYVRDRIMESNIKMDAAIWGHIEETMRPLYEGFKDANNQLGMPRQDPMKAKDTQIVAGMTYGQRSLKEVVVNTKSGLKA